MAVIDDYVTVVLLASSAFFVALSVGLLVRYRQVSQKMTASTDLGHDLWSALEGRMKKQDERILDMMGRLEVVQARVMAQVTTRPQVSPGPTTSQTPSSPPPEPETGGAATSKVTTRASGSQLKSQESQARLGEVSLDETQLAAIRLLLESPKNTRQLTDALGKSREHTARVMKELFEMGLVKRNDSTKPFVYQLTDEGSRLIPTS
jgi:DNA-binding MarR family transcriptional regulator